MALSSYVSEKLEPVEYDCTMKYHYFLLSHTVITYWGFQLSQYCSDGQSDWIFGSGVKFYLKKVYRHPLRPSGSLSPEITSSSLMFTLVLFSPSIALTTSLKALATAFPLLASTFHVRVAARRRVVVWLLALLPCHSH